MYARFDISKRTDGSIGLHQILACTEDGRTEIVSADMTLSPANVEQLRQFFRNETDEDPAYLAWLEERAAALADATPATDAEYHEYIEAVKT